MVWLESGDHIWSNQPWPGGQGHRGKIWLSEVHSLTPEEGFQVLGRHPRNPRYPTKYNVLNYSESYGAFTIRQTLGKAYFI